MDSCPLSDARFRIALTACPSVLSVSDTIQGLLGFEAASFRAGNVSLQALIHPGDQAIAERMFSPTESVVSETFNIRLRQANGLIRCFSGIYKKAYAEAGDVPERLVLDLVLVDAKSQRHQRQIACALSEADKLGALLANTDDYVYFKDRNHVFTGASQTLLELTSKAESWTDLIGKTDYDLFPEEYADIYYELEKQVFTGIRVAHEVQQTLTRDGQKGWVDNRKYPIRNAAGEIVGLFGIARDITEQKHIEDALRLSEERYRFLADNISDVIWTMNLEGRLTYVSPSIEKLCGYTPAEVMAQTLADVLAPNSCITASTALERIVAAIKAGEHAPGSRGEFEVRCKDGASVWTEVTSNAMRNPAGEFVGILGVSRDITQRKKMEDRVHQLAFHDPLTDLPNRRLLTDRLEQAMVASKRSGCYGAVMFLDLDNFKPLNDLHGHEVGDLLLIEVAERLKACVREMDTVARFGGDEFVVMVRELEVDKVRSTAQAAHIAEKIRVSLAAPYSLITTAGGTPVRTVEHRCSASIGVVLFNNHDADQKEILKWADAAMYRAKEAGRNRIHFHGAKA